jgi:hypothetical protein
VVLKTIYFWLSLLFLFILTSTSTSKIFAVDYLFDNFDSLENWTFIPSDENDFDSWSVNDNKLVGNIGKNGSSFLFSKKKNFGEDLKFEFDATNISGIDQGILFGVKDVSNYYILNTRFPEPLWSQDNKVNQMVLWKYYAGSYHELARIDLLNEFDFSLEKNTTYRFTITTSNSDNKINIYINEILFLSFMDQDLFFGGIGFWNWGGEFNRAKTINNYSNCLVNFDLSPTPTPTLKNKIIVLPGLGASWNSNAIVYNQQISDSEWKMTPFVNNYDGLIETLEKNGLEKNKDFFVWNYDWRKSISEISNKLNDFINEKVGVDEKVDLVGHSLGGVVTRIWSQDHKDDQRLGNLVTLGSPHTGSLDTYEVWNGGKVSKISGIDSIAMQILLYLQNKGPITDLTKIRSYAPVIKDLLPTENYVIKNHNIINISSLETKNNFLINKNIELLESELSLNSVVGIGFSTASFIRLGERSVFDKVLGLWPDGEPIGYNYTSGDNTVLETSAKFGSTESVILNSNHGEIVSNGINFLVEKLGLETKEISSLYQDNFVDSLVFYIGSPAKLTVTCGDDVFEESDSFILIKNKDYSDCNVNLKPTDNGVIHLVFGNTSNTDWNYLEKNVVLEKEENFLVDFGNGNIKFDKNNKDFLISSLNEDLKTIGLKNISKYLNSRNWNYIINKVFIYRKKNKENIVSKRILDNLYILSSIDNQKCDRKNNVLSWIFKYKEFLNKMITLKVRKKRISQFAALSFKNLEELSDKVNLDINNKECPNNTVINSLSIGYGIEVLTY